MRCDNDPAPWTRSAFGPMLFFCCSFLTNVLLILFINSSCSDEHGDRPRPLPKIPELKKAIEISERTESPSWDYDVSGHHQSFFSYLK